MWQNIQNDDGDIDIYPVGENHTSGASCICGPRVEMEGANLIFVHNAHDHREYIEEAVIIMNEAKKMTIVHDDEFCLNLLNDALRALRGNKQNVKDPNEARYWAVTVTELEKVVAYFEKFVVDVDLHSGEAG